MNPSANAYFCPQITLATSMSADVAYSLGPYGPLALCIQEV